MAGFDDFFWVDAFAGKPFCGNPAAVFLVKEWPSASVMQSLAAETALSETAFIKAAADDFEIRWFTPTMELELVGHATLAAAHAVMEYVQPQRSQVKFVFRDGVISARRIGDQIAIELPTDSIRPVPAVPDLCAGLGITPQETFQGRHHIAVLRSSADVAAIVPDHNILCRLPLPTIAITAPGEDCDYVLRFFAPRNGVPEDPVSGVAQCSLAPFWSERLGKKDLLSRQLSSRGALMRCTLQPSGVLVAGPCTLIFRGRANSSLLGTSLTG
jgi:PhzF family phenazine biosynthesis protein